MAERIDPAGLTLEEHIIDIWRCAAVIKGGRRFSFAAMVVVGNGAGIVGLGYGKAREVPLAIEKAVKDSKKNLVRISTYGTTIPHEVRGRFCTAKVALVPALPGTGLIAGQVTRALLECIGVHDILSKSVGGNNNPRNLAKATLDALLRLRSRDSIAKLRGVEIPEDAVLAKSLKAQPVRRRAFGEEREEERRGPGRGRRPREHGGEEGGGDSGGGRRRGPGRGPAPAPAPAAPAEAAPAAAPAAAAPVEAVATGEQKA